MGRHDSIAKSEFHAKAYNRFIFLLEEATFNRLQPSPAGNKILGRANNRIALHNIAIGQGSSTRNARILCKRIQNVSIDQRQRFGLKIDGS